MNTAVSNAVSNPTIAAAVARLDTANAALIRATRQLSRACKAYDEGASDDTNNVEALESAAAAVLGRIAAKNDATTVHAALVRRYAIDATITPL